MTDPVDSLDVRITGLWRSAHTFSRAGEDIGILSVQRSSKGMVNGGRYVPSKGEVLSIRRDPGLLRSQFSLWTEGQEWLGAALRWNILRREIVLHTGSKELRIQPLPGLRCGWTLRAAKTGQIARVLGRPLARKAKIEVYRRIDPELVVFTYFLGSHIMIESLWPGPPATKDMPTAAASPKA